MNKKIWVIGIVIAMILSVSGCGIISNLAKIKEGQEVDKDKKSEGVKDFFADEEENSDEQKGFNDEDGIINFETDDFSVVYTRHETGEDYNDEPCLFYYYMFTNKSTGNQNAMFAISLSAFQNLVECGSSFSMSDIAEIGNSMKDVQPGGSIEVCQVFKITDNSDVTMEVKKLISFSDDKDTQIIKLP